MSLDWIYTAISWILLSWHSAWDALGVGSAIGTNWAWILSIVFLVVTVRVILFPIFVKQIKSQRAMQALQPKVKELQEKHKGDRETLQQEIMKLYREEKANPLMGCLPMFLQIPVFLGLFHVLRRLNPDKVNKDLYGWTVEQFDSASHARLFTAPIAARFSSTADQLQSLDANGTTVKIIAAILVLMMMTTTYLTTKQMINRTGRAADPQQRMIQTLMLYGIPASLLVSGALFPIGVIIYWVTNNLFSLGQQQWVLRKYPPPALATSGKSGAAGGGTAARTGAAKKTAPQKKAAKGGTAKKAAKSGTGTQPVIDGKALAPRPGAKPVNPKKGGAAKRRVS
ncbi:MAG: membrane protein insertase YidC [Micromonosporaceae bacterium]|nr:membrane protein insertase YidC [Micromonosporaceae bacterium]